MGVFVLDGSMKHKYKLAIAVVPRVGLYAG